ncbi:dihydrofolate reductase family protein [Streptomyces sp. YC504]|uniref:Dihydrofolate reductase family protein n=1 Tax=Streptomyces mesophilus TaxID=1775132 RepID=A0A6G4XAS3_9ACTN|nr:dihydrofolate reductase family protein [Streptomyces mesophilus]NGO74639.1 dihydrofolate reductase family protein [Streptomyces mesophilus]
MRKLVETTFLTLDGVISTPEKYGPPYWDDEHDAYAAKLADRADALLLGRKTYEGFAQAWPQRSDAYADHINSMPKYVASRTLPAGDAPWNATVLSGDLAEAVAELKRQPGRDILKFGTGDSDRTLIEHGLVDEFHLWILPVIAGGGERILDGLDVTHLKHTGSTTLTSGIVVATYAPK